MGNKTKEFIVYFIAAVLIVIRADFWWWGKDFKPLLFNWLTWPEIYQLLIWLAGYALVAYTVFYIWTDGDEKEGEKHVS
jgi:hypothetical protein